MRIQDFDTSLLPSDMGRWYDSHLAKVGTARHAVEGITGRTLPLIRARLVRASQFGAEVSKARAGYEIRMTAALPAIVHFAFNCLLRTPQYMYGVGNAEEEQPYRASSRSIPLALPRGVRLEQAIPTITGLSRPSDPQRAAAAVLLTELAVAFCAYHELAHVLLGHVDAIQRWSGRAQLVELVGSGASTVGPSVRLRLVWEYEADMLAANMLLQDMLAQQAVDAFEGVYDADADTGPVGRVQAMLGAVLVVFLLVAQFTPSGRRSHPEPLVRFAAVANDCMAGLIEQNPPAGLTVEGGEEALNDVAIATLSAWRALGLGTSPASPLSNLLTAQRAVERLERDSAQLHVAHSELAQFYPFR